MAGDPVEAGRATPEVVLVGRRLPDAENLGLEYLVAALRASGRTAGMAPLNAWTDLEPIARRVVASGARLVGISLPDGNTSFLPLGLGELLRRRGFRGHVVAGGGFATLARDWLLARYAWLDSVVRFAGERPIVDLARALETDGDLSRVGGLTTRAGDGPPAPVADPWPTALRPARDRLPEILGMPMAHVAATRGCPARCAYCGPAALQTLERDEGARAGLDAAGLRRLGVGATRRRAIDEVCDELAWLFKASGRRLPPAARSPPGSRGRNPAMRARALALIFVVLGCGSGAEPERGHARHDEGGEHRHDHGDLPEALRAFHDVLAPLWHAEHGVGRADDTCAASGTFRERAASVQSDTVPEAAAADEAGWRASADALVASVEALAAECGAEGRPAFEERFAAVHDAFHAAMERARSAQ